MIIQGIIFAVPGFWILEYQLVYFTVGNIALATLSRNMYRNSFCKMYSIMEQSK